MRKFLAVFWILVSSYSVAYAGDVVAVYSTPSDSAVEALACGGKYQHGIKYTEAHAFGPAAVPHMRRILADEGMRHCWENAICIVSAIGSPDSYEILRGFVWDRFRGEVDEPTFGALEAATVTIGFTCPSRPAVVMAYLEQGANPQRWKELPWHYSKLGSAEMRERLSMFCIHGLSYCSDAKARSILLSLLHKPYARRHREAIRSSLKVQSKVAAMGLYEYERAASVGSRSGTTPPPPSQK